MNDLVKLWQEQPTTNVPMRIEEMEKKRRRALYDSYAAAAFISLGVIWLAAISPNLMMRIGAALTVLGFGFLAWQMRRHFGSPASMSEASTDAARAELERQLAFTRTGLWARVIALAPGPVVFSLGFAAAYPHAAPIIYFQIATFVLVLMAIVPLTRRKAAKLERELEELRALQN